MSEELKETLENGTPAEAVQVEASEEAVKTPDAKADVAPAAPAESMDNYAKELDASLRAADIKVGDLVTGIVTEVSSDGVIVNLANGANGLIRPLDYSGNPKFSPQRDVKTGEEVSAVVLREDDGRGNYVLSHREAVERLAWQGFKKMLDEKTETEIKIVDAVKGGVVGYLNGVRAFVPASQLSLSYVEDLSTFKGQTIPVRVITADEKKRRLVLSSKDILRERREAEKAERISNLKVGLVTEGKVASLQSYGAFVTLGDGIDGLVHISQIPNNGKRLAHAKDALEVGQTVKVKVTKVENGRISLSMRDALEEAPKKVTEEKVVIPKAENIGTSLGSLLKGIKLD